MVLIHLQKEDSIIQGQFCLRQGLNPIFYLIKDFALGWCESLHNLKSINAVKNVYKYIIK